MPKPVPKRSPSKIVVVHIETTADAIKRVMVWKLDPNNLQYSKADGGSYFNSGDIVEDNLSVKTVFDKVAHFIKGTNETGSQLTLPDLIIWDKIQLGVLQQHITNLATLIKPNIVILQERCYHIFKYNLSCQNFSLQEIAEVMGFENENYHNYARIALATERIFKDNAKKLKGEVKVVKKDKKIVKEDYVCNDLFEFQNK